jgi:hypothetical protein
MGFFDSEELKNLKYKIESLENSSRIKDETIKNLKEKNLILEKKIEVEKEELSFLRIQSKDYIAYDVSLTFGYQLSSWVFPIKTTLKDELKKNTELSLYIKILEEDLGKEKSDACKQKLEVLKDFCKQNSKEQNS